MIYSAIRQLLFQLEPEHAHHLTMYFLQKMHHWKLDGVLSNAYQPSTAVTVAGLQFPNRIGLAAGFDKNGKWISELAALGFGHIEIGTVTPKPQAGNPKPRLFRLKQDEAIINRMGFNNQGVDSMAGRLSHLKKTKGLILGGNIGKNKITSDEDAVLDYIECMKKLFPHVDYFTLNVSSPNTPGLRALQKKEPLERLLSSVKGEMSRSFESTKPIFLKIAPDIDAQELDDILEVVERCAIDGIVATNTTIDRQSLKTPSTQIEAIGQGGLSGKPLFDKSLRMVSEICKKTNHRLPVIGVGGIDSKDKTQAYLDAGASLVQLYTGFIYKGPSLVQQLAKL